MSRPTHRDLLLDAAKQLLREKGYARTTARDLVAASGTNLASIGYHFGSKDALLNEAIGEGFSEWTEHIGAAAEAAGDAPPLDRLAASWRAMVDDFPATRALFVAFLEALAQAERSPELRAQLAGHYEASRERVAAMIAETLGAEGIAPDDARVVASFLIAVCDGLLMQSFLDPERAPSGERLAEALGAALQSALSPRPAEGTPR
jgi:AcrR family transcriptional regulator